jgi:hypothetical protein
MARPLCCAAALVACMAPAAWAFDATVQDSTNQTVEIRGVRCTSGNETSDFLTVVTGTWTYEIHLGFVKEIRPDGNAAKKNAYEPTPFLVTLTSGAAVKGLVSITLSGDSDFGKATVSHDKIKSATFKKVASDGEFKPDKEGTPGTVKDTGGVSMQLSAVTIAPGYGNQSIQEISGTRGDVTLHIPVGEIEKIESAGEVKAERGSKIKWTITLFSGKSTELLLDATYIIKGEYEFGKVKLSAGQVQSVALKKK